MRAFPNFLVSAALGLSLQKEPGTSLSVRCGAIEGRPAVSLIPLHLKADAAGHLPLVCMHESAALFACVPTVKQLISLWHYISHLHRYPHRCFISFLFHSFSLSPLYFTQFSIISFLFVSLFVYPSTSPPFALGKGRRDSSVTVVTELGLDDRGKGKRFYSSSQLSDLLWGVKRSGREANSPTPPGVEVRMRAAVSPRLPHRTASLRCFTVTARLYT